MTWSSDEGKAACFGTTIDLQASDAYLFLNVFGDSLGLEQIEHLAARSLELGAVVMDADTTEIIGAAPLT